MASEGESPLMKSGYGQVKQRSGEDASLAVKLSPETGRIQVKHRLNRDTIEAWKEGSLLTYFGEGSNYRSNTVSKSR